jgi:hypothetical protein
MEILTYVPQERRWYDEDGFARDVELNLNDTLTEYRHGMIWHFDLTETEIDEFGLRSVYVELNKKEPCRP